MYDSSGPTQKITVQNSIDEQNSTDQHYQTMSHQDQGKVFSSDDVACDVLSGERLPFTSDISHLNPDDQQVS